MRSSASAAGADGSSFDLAGALTLTIGQMVLVYGVVEAGLVRLGHRTGAHPDHPRHRPARGVRRDRDAIRSAPLIPFKELTKPLQIANNIVLLFSARCSRCGS
jgi:hypothetical protein